MNIWQENQLGKLAKKVTKRLYQSLGINLGSTFVIQTDNEYDEDGVCDREITWLCK